MNRKKLIGILLVLLLISCAIVYGPQLLRKTGADLGGFSGDSDYGDSDSGSSWSSSNGGSSSDSDSGWSSSSSGGPGYASGSPAFFFIGCGIFMIGIIVLVVLDGKDRKEPARRAAQQPEKPKKVQPAGAQPTPDSRLTPMSEYVALDPDFSEAEIQKKLGDIYVRMQNACTARNLEPLRSFFTDGLYQRFDRQIRALIANRQINHVEQIDVQKVNLRGFFQEGGKDHLVVEVIARITDYTEDEDNGRLISGSRTARKRMTYEWDLSRPTGMQTQKRGTDTDRRCPNCGAVIAANESAQCPYCGALITFKDHDWTICAIKGIAQKTEHNYPCWPDV